MSKLSFQRKCEFINKRYPEAPDDFKAKRLLLLCENKEYERLI